MFKKKKEGLNSEKCTLVSLVLKFNLKLFFNEKN